MIKLINKTISAVREIARGMATIGKHFFRKPITLEYPEVKPQFNDRQRGRLALLTNPDGSDLCIGCMSCAKVCPCGDLIHIKAVRDKETKKVDVQEFTIDIGRCIFCGNCTEVCPTNAIVCTDEFELADYSRGSLVLDKKGLTKSPQESEKWKSKK